MFEFEMLVSKIPKVEDLKAVEGTLRQGTDKIVQKKKIRGISVGASGFRWTASGWTPPRSSFTERATCGGDAPQASC